MIYVLAGIVVLCGFMCLAEALVWLWDKLDPPAEVQEVRSDEA